MKIQQTHCLIESLLGWVSTSKVCNSNAQLDCAHVYNCHLKLKNVFWQMIDCFRKTGQLGTCGVNGERDKVCILLDRWVLDRSCFNFCSILFVWGIHSACSESPRLTVDALNFDIWILRNVIRRIESSHSPVRLSLSHSFPLSSVYKNKKKQRILIPIMHYFLLKSHS